MKTKDKPRALALAIGSVDLAVYLLRKIDAYEEETGHAVLYGEDRLLLELGNNPCSGCDPSFSCWNGSALCRKQAARILPPNVEISHATKGVSTPDGR